MGVCVGCSACKESLGGFGRAAEPGLRGAGGQGAMGQAFSFDFCCVCPEHGHHSVEGATVQISVAFSSFKEEAVSWSTYRTGSPRKRELIYQHRFASCPRASSASRVFSEFRVFLVCSYAGSMPGREGSQGQVQKKVQGMWK